MPCVDGCGSSHYDKARARCKGSSRNWREPMKTAKRHRPIVRRCLLSTIIWRAVRRSSHATNGARGRWARAQTADVPAMVRQSTRCGDAQSHRDQRILEIVEPGQIHQHHWSMRARACRAPDQGTARLVVGQRLRGRPAKLERNSNLSSVPLRAS